MVRSCRPGRGWTTSSSTAGEIPAELDVAAELDGRSNDLVQQAAGQ